MPYAWIYFLGNSIYNYEVEKEKGLMDMDNSIVTAGGRVIRGLNFNGNKYNKAYIQNKWISKIVFICET